MAVTMAPQSRTIPMLLLAAQVLTLVALLFGVVFLFETTGANLLLFSTVAPLLAAISIAILIGVAIYEHRSSRIFEIETYEPGDIIFHEGDEGDCVYFIHSGEVEIVRAQDGHPQVIAQLGKGQYFGEMALITNARRNATVRAASKLRVAALGKKDFLTLLTVLPATKEDIMKTVQARAMEQAAQHK